MPINSIKSIILVTLGEKNGVVHLCLRSSIKRQKEYIYIYKENMLCDSALTSEANKQVLVRS
jgi:hypothetical protein